MSVPTFSIFCIDYRYDDLTSNFFQTIGLRNSYFAATTAGGALSLGYKCSCSKGSCQENDCKPNQRKDMALLRDALVKNLDIALSLQPKLKQINLLNHQDCGAIKAFLGCSGYPTQIGNNNPKEIKINERILTCAKKYLSEKYDGKIINLKLIDVNGSVAEYDTNTKKWTLIHTGPGKNSNGLWYNYCF
jgi:hypothetical protein